MTEVTEEIRISTAGRLLQRANQKELCDLPSARHRRHLAQVWIVWRTSMSRLLSSRKLSPRGSVALLTRQAPLTLECPRSASVPGRPCTDTAWRRLATARRPAGRSATSLTCSLSVVRRRDRGHPLRLRSTSRCMRRSSPQPMAPKQDRRPLCRSTGRLK